MSRVYPCITWKYSEFDFTHEQGNVPYHLAYLLGDCLCGFVTDFLPQSSFGLPLFMLLFRLPQQAQYRRYVTRRIIVGGLCFWALLSLVIFSLITALVILILVTSLLLILSSLIGYLKIRIQLVSWISI